jgi:hypothetical protein
LGARGWQGGRDSHCIWENPRRSITSTSRRVRNSLEKSRCAKPTDDANVVGESEKRFITTSD